MFVSNYCIDHNEAFNTVMPQGTECAFGGPVLFQQDGRLVKWCVLCFPCRRFTVNKQKLKVRI